jgi:hypothetical protein
VRDRQKDKVKRKGRKKTCTINIKRKERSISKETKEERR